MDFREELNKLIEQHDREVRSKAVDEFAEILKQRHGCLGWIDEIAFEKVDDIAEQIKNNN